MSEPVVTVVGVGADGWRGIPVPWHDEFMPADVILGSPRLLAMVDQMQDVVLEPWPRPLREGLPALLERYAGRRVVALASGDPLVSGIGATLVDVLGADRVRILPNVSSVALARARMGWPAETTAVVSLVGRDPHLLLRELAPGRRIVVLSADATTPAVVADLLQSTGHGDSTVTVLGDLGGPDETRDAEPPPALNVVCVEVAGPGTSWAPGLPDELFEHDGQLTKRDVRASALARLAPAPGQLLWDVGAGAGSVGIEWMRAHPTCRAVAVEADPERAARIERNAAALGAPGLRVVNGSAPDALTDLPAPDAVFVGGGVTRPVLEACLHAPRLVVHGVTLETETLLAAMYAEHGGELTRLHVEHAAPLGSFTGWTPARAVTQWSHRR